MCFSEFPLIFSPLLPGKPELLILSPLLPVADFRFHLCTWGSRLYNRRGSQDKWVCECGGSPLPSSLAPSSEVGIKLKYDTFA